MVVSNTSPLRYLIVVGQAGLIGKVFQQVLIPPAVIAELTHPSAPPEVRLWMAQPPAWLVMQTLQRQPAPELLRTLDRGEAEALQLALETRADFVLMDERLGRRAGLSLGLTLIGALGLLRESYRQQLVLDPLQVLDQMKRIGFRISPALARQFQQEIQSMRSQ